MRKELNHEAAQMESSVDRPRLLWFRSVRGGLPDFIMDQFSQHVRTMANFFEVRVAEANGDYDAMCDLYQPDLCVFESGVDVGPRRITRTHTHPEVLKIGFLNADAYDTSRAAFIADMERWGVNTYFTHSMAMSDYTPEIADRLFVWPNRVESEIYRDVPRTKTVPVLLTGSRGPQYPWRNAVSRTLSENFISTTLPHFGWGSSPNEARMSWGTSYAHLLSSAVFAPTCGSMSRDLLRKHLEIPAAGVCLVTERTAVVEAAGFRDMVNCVFAERYNVVARLEELLAEPDLLARITEVGRDFVLTHHSAERRDQVLQWYRMARASGSEIQFEQSWPDGVLTASSGLRAVKEAPIVTAGLDRTEIGQGWRALRRGDAELAREAFLRALNFFFIPEAAVGLIFAFLLIGDTRAAQTRLSRLLATSLSHYGSEVPDPVFWACQIRIYLCSGNLPAAALAAGRYVELRHPELDRMRQAALVGAGSEAKPELAESSWPSIAPVPHIPLGEWEVELATMRKACQRQRAEIANFGGRLLPARLVSRLASRAVQKLLAKQAAGHAEAAVRRIARAGLAPIRQRLCEDDLSSFIVDFASRDLIGSAVLVEGGRPSRAGRAVRKGLARNPHLHTLHTLGGPGTVELLPVFESGSPARDELDDCQGGHLVFVSQTGWNRLSENYVLDSAKTVILEGTLTRKGADALESLLGGGDFSLVRHEPYQRGGYAVLTRRSRRRCTENAMSVASDVVQEEA